MFTNKGIHTAVQARLLTTVGGS